MDLPLETGSNIGNLYFQKLISKCEELIKWIGDFLPEANRDMVSTRLRALMNHDEIQETSTGHVVVSREFRAKIRSKSVPGTLFYIDRFII